MTKAKGKVYTGQEIVLLYVCLKKWAPKELDNLFAGGSAIMKAKEFIVEKKLEENLIQYLCDQDDNEISFATSEKSASAEAIKHAVSNGAISVEDGMHIKTLLEKLEG